MLTLTVEDKKYRMLQHMIMFASQSAKPNCIYCQCGFGDLHINGVTWLNGGEVRGGDRSSN